VNLVSENILFALRRHCWTVISKYKRTGNNHTIIAATD